VTDHKNVSGEAFSILLEMGFSPKDTVRAGHYVLYFKQSEAIEDLFTTLGAPGSAMAIMSAKVEKDMRNAVNRRVNCDSANADKIVQRRRRRSFKIGRSAWTTCRRSSRRSRCCASRTGGEPRRPRRALRSARHECCITTGCASSWLAR
jgi:hypothetical protein